MNSLPEKINSFYKLGRETKSGWSGEEETKAIDNLRNWDQLGLKRKFDDLYNQRKNYVIKDFAGVSKIVTKKDHELIAIKETVTD